MPELKYPKSEIALRGEELYEACIRARVEEKFDGKIIVIDVESGDYEIDDSTLNAANRLKLKHPDAVMYSLRVGYQVVYSFRGVPSRRSKR